MKTSNVCEVKSQSQINSYKSFKRNREEFFIRKKAAQENKELGDLFGCNETEI